MKCTNCGCQSKAITVSLEKKKWSAAQLAADRRRQLTEEQNVLQWQAVSTVEGERDALQQLQHEPVSGTERPGLGTVEPKPGEI
jgi:hypothetical protein